MTIDRATAILVVCLLLIAAVFALGVEAGRAAAGGPATSGTAHVATPSTLSTPRAMGG